MPTTTPPASLWPHPTHVRHSSPSSVTMCTCQSLCISPPPPPPPPRPTGTPFDPVSVEQLPDVISQLTYFQWNYKDVYVPPHLLHGLLTESNAMERQIAVWKYASTGKSASIVSA